MYIVHRVVAFLQHVTDGNLSRVYPFPLLVHSARPAPACPVNAVNRCGHSCDTMRCPRPRDSSRLTARPSLDNSARFPPPALDDEACAPHPTGSHLTAPTGNRRYDFPVNMRVRVLSSSSHTQQKEARQSERNRRVCNFPRKIFCSLGGK